MELALVNHQSNTDLRRASSSSIYKRLRTVRLMVTKSIGGLGCRISNDRITADLNEVSNKEIEEVQVMVDDTGLPNIDLGSLFKSPPTTTE